LPPRRKSGFDTGYFVSHSPTARAPARETEFALLRAYHDRQFRLRRVDALIHQMLVIQPSTYQTVVIGYFLHREFGKCRPRHTMRAVGM
jgi:hypothetical protein